MTNDRHIPRIPYLFISILYIYFYILFIVIKDIKNKNIVIEIYRDMVCIILTMTKVSGLGSV